MSMAARAEAGPSALRQQSTSHLNPLPATHPLSLKLRAIFDSTKSFSADSEDTQKALQEIEQRYAKETNEEAHWKLASEAHVVVDTELARESLARDAQDSLEEACFEFLDSLQSVDSSLAVLGDAMRDLQTTCNDIEGELNRADESTKFLLQHADGIRKQMSKTSQQSVLLELFLSRFSLTPSQLATIETQAEAVGTPLFDAMDRLQEIRRDSHVLLIGQEEGTDGGMRAGLDVMDETSNLLDRAYQKLAKWLHFEMRSFSREGVDVGSNVREGIKRLEEREDLLRSVLKTLAATRGQHLSSTFQRALTVGGPAPTFLPRPIELHAHNPMRYIGDMLAWVHQAVASEREFLSGMFSRVNSDDMESGRRPGQRRRGLEGSVDWTKVDGLGLSKGEKWTREVLDKMMEGCSLLLKNRIEQTLQSQEGCITSFKLASLIQFYRVVMDRTIGPKAILSKRLAEVSVFAFQAFLSTVEKMAAGLSRFHEPPDSSLSLPPPLLGACATLRELLGVHQASLSESDVYGDLLPFADVDKSGKAMDFSGVVQRFIDPVLELCLRLSEMIPATKKQRGGKVDEEGVEWNTNIFLINCSDHVRTVLELFHFTHESRTKIERNLKERMATLVRLHYKRLYLESGLDRQDDPLSAFEAFLSSPLLLAPPSLELLSAPTRRSSVHTEALSLLASEYDNVVGRQSSSNASGQPPRHPDELRMLLGITPSPPGPHVASSS